MALLLNLVGKVITILAGPLVDPIAEVARNSVVLREEPCGMLSGSASVVSAY